MNTPDMEHGAKPRTSRGARTVVCVDDEPLIREALHRLLRREPYNLYIAETPERALSYIQEHDVNLLVADQRMPGMSGTELLEEVRKVSPLTRGLILTAYPESILVAETPGGPPPLFAKPWDDNTLRKSIQDVLREPAREEKTPSVTQEARLLTVLAPLDGSPEAEAALTAIEPFQRLGPIGVEILRVLPHMGFYRDVSAYLEKWGKRMTESGMDVGYDVRWGDPTDQILRHARHVRADLIALSTQGKGGIARFFRGSVPERILRESAVPLFVCRPGMPVRPWRRILVPLDGSEQAEAVLPDAVRLARSAWATLDVVRSAARPYLTGGFGYVLPPEDPVPYLRAITNRLEIDEVSAEFTALDGPPAREIARHAELTHADLICMSSSGRRGLARWLGGSVAEEVIRTGPCPVLVRRIRPGRSTGRPELGQFTPLFSG